MRLRKERVSSESGLRWARRADELFHMFCGGAWFSLFLARVVGIVSSLLLTRSLSSLLFEVSPLDLLSFSAAVTLLAFVSIGASLLPAWRASRVDPIIAMQNE